MTQQLCTFTIDDELFGIEVLSIREILRWRPLTPIPLTPPAIRSIAPRRSARTRPPNTMPTPEGRDHHSQWSLRPHRVTVRET